MDRFLTSEKPWKIAEDTSQGAVLGNVLYTALESLRWITVLAHPVIPEATQKIWEALGQTGPLGEVRIDQLKWGDLKPGTRVRKPEAVFPRVDKTEAMERIEAMEQEIRGEGAAKATEAPSAGSAAAPTGSPAAAATAATGATTAAAATAAPTDGTAKIGIEDFAKVELRVGLVKSAEKVAGRGQAAEADGRYWR